jgi:hypothetical protein
MRYPIVSARWGQTRLCTTTQPWPMVAGASLLGRPSGRGWGGVAGCVEAAGLELVLLQSADSSSGAEKERA